MNVIQRIRSLFGNDSDDGLEVLADLLQEREAGLDLEARYRQPTVNTVGETTAVFPVTLLHEGDLYGTSEKEFVVPDSGLDDTDAPLTTFVANANGIDGDDVTFADLRAIEGMESDARLTAEGDTVVECPSGETEQVVDSVDTDVEADADDEDEDEQTDEETADTNEDE